MPSDHCNFLKAPSATFTAQTAAEFVISKLD
jgi:hypothetical protein